MDRLTTLIGQLLIYGGGGIAIGYGLFKAFGVKWLEAQFSERLQRLKTEQDQQLRNAQATIDREIHRARKLYDREFDVLPETWSLFCKIFDMASATGMSSAPRLERFTPAEIEDFLSTTEMREIEKDDFRRVDPAERTKHFQRWADYRRLHRCYDARIAYQNYLDANAIFFSAGLKEKFVAIDVLIGMALGDFHGRLDMPSLATFDHIRELLSKGVPLRKELETLIRERLWSSDRLAEKSA